MVEDRFDMGWWRRYGDLGVIQMSNGVFGDDVD